MPQESHPFVRAIHDAANVVSHHGEAQGSSSLRQWLFGQRHQRLYDKVASFRHALNLLLDVPPTMLTQADIAAIGADVERVVQCAEREIARNDTPGEPLGSFPTAIYAIRARYEEIYRRGGMKGA